MSTATEPATFVPVTAQGAPYFAEKLETAAMYLRDSLAALDGRRVGAAGVELAMATGVIESLDVEYCTPGYPVFCDIPTCMLRGVLRGILRRAEDASERYSDRPSAASLAGVRAAVATNLAAVEGLLVGIALATDPQAAS